MKKLSKVLIQLLLLSGLALTAYAQPVLVPDTADDISTTTSGFNNNLSAADNTVQKALDTIDNLSIGAGSGDITDVFGCTSGNCSALTAASGDSLNMASGDSSIPAPQSTSLPGTCTEGMQYQDTNSGGSEYYICTATNTWTKLTTASDWDTIGELESNLGSVNVILATEIDTANELAAIMTEVTGTGSFVRATSPTLVTPALGTIASGVGTALTALNGENIQDDTIDDDSIDFGTGTDQVSTDDLPQGSTNLYSTLTNIQTATSNDFHNIGGTDDDVPEAGDFTNLSGTSNEITQSGGTISLPATIDLGGKTSFEVPNGASPTVDEFGEFAGDNNFWGSSRGALVLYDGTSTVGMVGILSTDTCTNGQVAKFNTGGTWTCEDDTQSAGSATAWDDITDPDAAASINFAGFDQDITSAEDGGDILTITNSDPDRASDSIILKLADNDGADANAIYLRMVGDDDGTPTNDYTFSQTGFTSLLDITVPTEAYDATGWNGDNTVPTKDAVRDKIETISAGATAWDDIGDPDADTTIVLAGFETDLTSTLDSNGKAILTITNTDADTAADTDFIDLFHNDGADANVFYFKATGDADGTPQVDYRFSQTAALIRPDLTVTGDLTITGDDLFMTTNTSGAILVADGTNFNPVVMSSDASIAANGAVTLASGITRDTEWDTIGEIETATSVNIIVATEIDTSSELAGILGNETGTGLVVFNDSPTFADDITIHATGVKLTGDGDGALTLLGLGDGSDEDLTINLDDQSNHVDISSSTGVTDIDHNGMAVQADNGFKTGVGTDADAQLITVLRNSGNAAINWDDSVDMFKSTHGMQFAGTGDGVTVTASAMTTQTAFVATDANSLTTGKIANFVSNSADTSTRTLVQITNDNSAAVGTTVLKIQQDAGAPALTVTAGRVGLGTTAPSTDLHVVGNARITGLVSCDTIDTDSNGVLSCGTDDGSGGAGDVTAVGDCTTGACFGGAAGTSLVFNNAGGDGTLAYDGTNFTTDKPIAVSGSGDSYLNASSGNVGIGKTDPAFLLDVDGIMNATSIYKGGAAISLTGLSDVSSSTKTAGNILVANGTNFASVSVSGAATLSSAGVVTTKDTKCINIDPASTTTDWIMWKAPANITVTGVDCIVDASTSVVLTPNECNSNGASCSAIEAAITCATTNTTEASSIDNASVDAGDYVRVTRGTVTGSPTQAVICIEYTTP